MLFSFLVFHFLLFVFQIPKIVFWPIISLIHVFDALFWTIYDFVLHSCKISRFINFYISAVNLRKFQFMPTKYPNMLKTTRVYFGVLQQLSLSPIDDGPDSSKD